jgi:uncharacterized YccA/Bax inhibitor family protein
MQSNNPVFRNSDAFNKQPGYNQYGNQTYPGNGAAYPGYAQPPGGYPGSGDWTTETGAGTRMTIDTVVQKTAFSLGIVVVVAALAWMLTGDATVDQTALGQLMMLSVVGSVAAFVLSLVNSFKRTISPGLVIAFAAFEGLFVGAFSKLMETYFGGGIVVGAVLGTFAAVGGTLAAYKFFNIQVSNRMRKFVVAAMFGFVALSLLDLMLSFFGASFGFNGFGPMGLLASVIGLVIAVFMLLLDFDFIEGGVAAGLPERESWRAAFGLTVTIVWIYTNLLRIMAILRGE